MGWTAKNQLKAPLPVHVFARFLFNVKMTDTCHLWIGRKNKDGYGQFSYRGITWMAHRILFESLFGPAPLDMTIDHECNVKNCVNPNHLRLLTNKANILRGNCTGAKHARKTHCYKGHEFTKQNTRMEGNLRRCKTCHRLRQRKYYHAKTNGQGG